MKNSFIILMLLMTSFVFSLDNQPSPKGEGSPLDRTAVQRALEEEQAAAIKYQEQLAANKKIIENMHNDAKKKDYQERLAKLRYRKSVLEFNIKKTRITVEKEKLLPELDAVAEEYSTLLHEFETFVNSLN
jgi:hypothetical protein